MDNIGWKVFMFIFTCIIIIELIFDTNLGEIVGLTIIAILCLIAWVWVKGSEEVLEYFNKLFKWRF